MRLLFALVAGYHCAQLFTENCFKFGIDSVSKNFGGRGKRNAEADPELNYSDDYSDDDAIDFDKMSRRAAMGRIVNGTAAEYEMWPFIAMIGFRGYGGIGKIYNLVLE